MDNPFRLKQATYGWLEKDGCKAAPMEAEVRIVLVQADGPQGGVTRSEADAQAGLSTPVWELQSGRWDQEDPWKAEDYDD